MKANVSKLSVVQLQSLLTVKGVDFTAIKEDVTKLQKKVVASYELDSIEDLIEVADVAKTNVKYGKDRLKQSIVNQVQKHGTIYGSGIAISKGMGCEIKVKDIVDCEYTNKNNNNIFGMMLIGTNTTTNTPLSDVSSSKPYRTMLHESLVDFEFDVNSTYRITSMQYNAVTGVEFVR